MLNINVSAEYLELFIRPITVSKYCTLTTSITWHISKCLRYSSQFHTETINGNFIEKIDKYSIKHYQSSQLTETLKNK